MAESALELVPTIKNKEVINERRRKRKAKNLSKLILDVSNHLNIIRGLDIPEKRGRPDIIHTTLLFILGSPLNMKGYVNTYIHTINDYIIWVNPKTRIPKNYNRFKGVIAKLFLEEEIKTNSDILLKMRKKTMTSLVRELLCNEIFVLTEKGKKITALNLARDIIKSTTPCIIIGGFPHGDFSSNIYSLDATFVSIYPESLHTWIVTAKIISSIENLLAL